MVEKRDSNDRGGSTIAKELLFGMISIALGGYNLLSYFDIVKWGVDIPQLIGNILLVLVGFILLMTAFKLWRIKWHTSRLF